MRTTLDLPTALLYKAKQISGSRTKTETIIRGLEALLRQGKRGDLLELRGKLPLQIDLRKSRKRLSER